MRIMRQGAYLTGASAHESCVAMLQARDCQELAHSWRRILLIAAAHQQRDAAQQDVKGQAVVPGLWPACASSLTCTSYCDLFAFSESIK